MAKINSSLFSPCSAVQKSAIKVLLEPCSLESLEERILPRPFQLWVAQGFLWLGLWLRVSAFSASVFTWASPLWCLSAYCPHLIRTQWQDVGPTVNPGWFYLQALKIEALWRYSPSYRSPISQFTFWVMWTLGNTIHLLHIPNQKCWGVQTCFDKGRFCCWTDPVCHRWALWPNQVIYTVEPWIPHL